MCRCRFGACLAMRNARPEGTIFSVQQSSITIEGVFGSDSTVEWTPKKPVRTGNQRMRKGARHLPGNFDPVPQALSPVRNGATYWVNQRLASKNPFRRHIERGPNGQLQGRAAFGTGSRATWNCTGCASLPFSEQILSQRLASLPTAGMYSISS